MVICLQCSTAKPDALDWRFCSLSGQNIAAELYVTRITLTGACLGVAVFSTGPAAVARALSGALAGGWRVGAGTGFGDGQTARFTRLGTRRSTRLLPLRPPAVYYNT